MYFQSDVYVTVFINDSYNLKGILNRSVLTSLCAMALIYAEISVVLISHVGMYGARDFQRLSTWGWEWGWG